MADQIDSSGAKILQNYHVSKHQLGTAVGKLSSGDALARPGENPVSFEKVGEMDLDRATEMASARAGQNRVSWYQTTAVYLSHITDILTTMSTSALKASSSQMSAEDLQVLDTAFQEYKQEISAIVDGAAGTKAPRATYNDLPLFIGFTPPSEIGAHVTTNQAGIEELNLYTGVGREGFNTLPLLTQTSIPPVNAILTGTAAAGSATTMTLDASGSSIDEVYAGMTVTITAGTGIGQQGTIASYNGETRVATFTGALGTALDGTSEYTLDSGVSNDTLVAVETFTTAAVAEHVWGADNDRLDRLTANGADFRALTETEQAYRTANAIPATDMEAKTYEEKQARRRLNIFDPEYGHISDSDSARRMLGQVQNALNQVTVLMQRNDARAAHVRTQIETSTNKSTMLAEGKEALSAVDIPRTVQQYQELTLGSERTLNLAQRLNENLGQLNQLVQNRGTR